MSLLKQEEQTSHPGGVQGCRESTESSTDTGALSLFSGILYSESWVRHTQYPQTQQLQ